MTREQVALTGYIRERGGFKASSFSASRAGLRATETFLIMKYYILLGVVVVIVMGRPQDDTENGFQEGCNTYCRKPEGPNKGDNYCCGPESLPVKREERHRGRCPTPLSQCTSRFAAFSQPQMCPHDGHCPRDQKCCFDTCLDHHTCKPAQ